VKENSWLFLMVAAELQLQPMLIVIRMGVAHSEVYWPHQMELQVSLILFIKNLESLLHFIIESNTPSLL
jgi:hypothetical protein